jgi:DNA polymerase-3 subunit gamma/tau
MTFYLSYRPRNLSELDSESVRQSLTKIVASQNIPHAFLFNGPKGTGKTSAARVLAKILNCTTNKKYSEPCNKCDQCKSIDVGSNLDVIEIDAASHRGIDDIRSLRDAVKLAPVSATKKVYIIDEAHMLTTEASNALLKTLEEPPTHVVFILATTNPEKLIETIRSRCQIINFKRANTQELMRSIARIAQAEKYKIDDKGLEIIAKYSDGSFRDGVKLLEQLVNEGVKPKFADIKEFLEDKKVIDVDTLLSLIRKRQLGQTLTRIEELAQTGAVFTEIITRILANLHRLLLIQSGVEEGEMEDLDRESLIELIELLQKAKNDTPQASVEQLPLELAVIKWCDSGESEEVKIEEKVYVEPTVEGKRDHKKSDILEIKQSGKSKIDKIISSEQWNMILTKVKPLNTSIEALLRAAKPVEFDGHTLTLGVYYRFHKERLEENKNKTVLEQVVGEIFNQPTRIVCILTEPAMKVVNQSREETVLEEAKDADIVNVAKKIFES